MDRNVFAEKIIAARRKFAPQGGFEIPADHGAAEGGCGVIGLACSEQVAARHMLQALQQMRNRGNGKGGGIAAVGLVPQEFGVSAEVMQNDYLIAIAYLHPEVRPKVERQYINAVFKVDHVHEQAHLTDFTSIAGLDVQPPEVVLYFVRIKPKVLSAYAEENGLQGLPARALEDEFVYQNSYRLNTAYYASIGEREIAEQVPEKKPGQLQVEASSKQAFVLSHGKNMLVLKMVGYGDDVIRYYQLENMHAHVWIGHHRYPTKGRVWHPGGAHPFVGLNEALVHNGDFANYASITEYLAQRNIFPLFLTDTEVSVQVFDLLYRTYGYPLEYVIETLAPTTELDFALLPPEKQRIYKLLQTTHMHASPDGPWFFLIAQSDTNQAANPVYRLTGITDTSMLRPQVFAWQAGSDKDGKQVAIGFAASEKQGIDAALQSLAEADGRFWPRADRYWNARGGSHTDGGAFVFSVTPNANGHAKLTCTNKFGAAEQAPTNTAAYHSNDTKPAAVTLPNLDAPALTAWAIQQLLKWQYKDVLGFLKQLENLARKDQGQAIEVLTRLIDARYPCGKLRRSSLLALYDQTLGAVFDLIHQTPTEEFVYHAYGETLPTPAAEDQTIVIDARGYPPEGPDSLAAEIVHLYTHGFKRFIVAHAQGHRFIGNGFGPDAADVQIDVYGSSGDYLASGIDGIQLNVHGNAQDQLAQIMKSGTLVVHGDVGQTFMYGAKGGEAYILGNAAGRPLINAVGKPRVVINGTCLDYLAESFMAGDPLHNGGFVVLNGITFDEDNQIIDLETPYPGGNLFSLASGGAIYIRDPHHVVLDEQLNGGEFVELSAADWKLIQPYLEKNAELFGVPLERLLNVDDETLPPEQVYRKIQPHTLRALQAEEAWVRKAAD